MQIGKEIEMDAAVGCVGVRARLSSAVLGYQAIPHVHTHLGYMKVQQPCHCKKTYLPKLGCLGCNLVSSFGLNQSSCLLNSPCLYNNMYK